ncbi:ABC transporter ATP-binding protein [Streptococcus gordonii]|uniref:ABC transporter ATP-binding protein n=1 Tax=Streptococcus gordonii TaxID=1302 RepID=UPI000E494545|nr:ABC transporter ATP-binding protein [Streptococcus gordonii]RHE64434.1 ABC transporter ATP-binding protein [Streptococcus gordonii]
MTSKRNVEKIIFYHNRISFTIAVIFSMLSAIIEMLLAFSFMYLINYAQLGDMSKVINIIESVIIGALFYIILVFLGSRSKSTYVKRAVINLRRELLDSIVTKPMNQIGKKPQGAYISMLTNDLLKVEQDYIIALVDIIRFIFLFISSVCAMFYLEWRLTLVVLLANSLLLLLSLFFGNLLKNNQEKITYMNQSLTSTIKDMLSGLTVVKAFHVENKMLASINNISENTEAHKRKYANYTGVQTGLLTIVSLMIVIAIFGIGSYWSIRGDMTVGTIIAFVQLLNNLAIPTSNLSLLANKRKSCDPIIEQYLAMLDKPKKTEKVKIEEKDFHYIELKNLSYSTSDGVKILNDISYRFEADKNYAIVGASGSGKSTLLNLISGFNNAYKGNIYFDGIEIRDVEEESLYSLLSIVQQDTFIFNDTIRNNINLYRIDNEQDFNDAVNCAELDSVFKTRTAEFECGENGVNLSGGEKQRIAIARSLIRKTPIIIMDEGTSALDQITTSNIERNLKHIPNLMRISVTHKLNAKILQLYDVILVMKEGKIVEEGEYEELMERKGDFYALMRVIGTN